MFFWAKRESELFFFFLGGGRGRQLLGFNVFCLGCVLGCFWMFLCVHLCRLLFFWDLLFVFVRCVAIFWMTVGVLFCVDAWSPVCWSDVSEDHLIHL